MRPNVRRLLALVGGLTAGVALAGLLAPETDTGASGLVLGLGLGCLVAALIEG